MSDLTLGNLDAKIDALGARRGSLFLFRSRRLDERLRKEINERFARVDRHFDGMDERFDRLEKLIKVRPIAPGKRSRSRP